MKLYATTTSERASKGQGGNEYLNIDIMINDKTTPAYHIRINDAIIELLDNKKSILFIEDHKSKKLKMNI